MTGITVMEWTAPSPASVSVEMCHDGVVESHQGERLPRAASITDLSSVTTIGLDIAKNVFRVHGIDEAGEVLVARSLRRGKVLAFFSGLASCLVGLEACATAHHWARELAKLGHEVRLIPPSYVKAHVRRQKNDAADAAAICEAVTRPSMRFVPVKTMEQQSVAIR